MSNFRTIDRETGFLLPPSVDEWLPSVDEWLPEKHLARFVVEVVDGLDLRAMSGSYRGSGSASYHPRMLLGLLVYGYATGVFSSRKLERATYDLVAFRFIAANDHPDHDTIATFRRRFLKEIEALFVQVLQLAREMGVLKMGTVALDGTKIYANASRHSALSYEHAGKGRGAVESRGRRSDGQSRSGRRGGHSRRGYGLFQRGERRGLRQGGDRTADRHGPSAASSAVGRALPSGAGSAARSNAGRGDGASAEDAGRPGALRAAQADAGAGVRDHQIGAGIPSIFAARPRGRARRMEPRHHGLEHQADVRPRPGLTRLRCAGSADCRPLNADIRPRNPFDDNPPTSGRPSKRQKSLSAINRKTQSDRLLEAAPAYLPTCAVRGGDPQQPQYVDSGRRVLTSRPSPPPSAPFPD